MASPLNPVNRLMRRVQWPAVAPYVTKMQLRFDPLDGSALGARCVAPEGGLSAPPAAARCPSALARALSLAPPSFCRGGPCPSRRTPGLCACSRVRRELWRQSRSPKVRETQLVVVLVVVVLLVAHAVVPPSLTPSGPGRGCRL